MQSQYITRGVDRFVSKIDMSAGENACWPWIGSRVAYGYGQFGVRGNAVSRILTGERWQHMTTAEERAHFIAMGKLTRSGANHWRVRARAIHKNINVGG